MAPGFTGAHVTLPTARVCAATIRQRQPGGSAHVALEVHVRHLFCVCVCV